MVMLTNISLATTTLHSACTFCFGWSDESWPNDPQKISTIEYLTIALKMDDRGILAYSDLSESDVELVNRVTTMVQQYFDDPQFDASHDWLHVERVTKTAMFILNQELERRISQEGKAFHRLTVILGALLHDVGDRKYSSPLLVADWQVKPLLIELGATERFAAKIQRLTQAVSFSFEVENVDATERLIVDIPELAIVQDADRLDALGAVGIARCFTFGGAKKCRSLDASVRHFDEKLLRLEAMMKTETGRDLARQRTERLRQFMAWYREEILPPSQA